MKVFKICKVTENGLAVNYVGVPSSKEGKALKSEFPPVDVTATAQDTLNEYLKECDNPIVKALVNGGEY